MTAHSTVLFYVIWCFYVLTCFHAYSRNVGHRRSAERFGRKNSITNYDKNMTQLNTVKMTVYYETLCPASVDFMTSELVPAIQSLSDRLDVHLIPYGHARTRRMHRRYRFTCQHGPAECYGNMLHACSIHAMRNATRSVLLNACLMQHSFYRPGVGYSYDDALNWCSYIMGVSVNEVRHCVNSENGSLLLKQYGDETYRLKPHYVPYVMLDEEKYEGTGSLVTLICQKLNPKPEICMRTRNTRHIIV